MTQKNASDRPRRHQCSHLAALKSISLSHCVDTQHDSARNGQTVIYFGQIIVWILSISFGPHDFHLPIHQKYNPGKKIVKLEQGRQANSTSSRQPGLFLMKSFSKISCLSLPRINFLHLGYPLYHVL